MSRTKTFAFGILLALVALALAACGGGGGDSSESTATSNAESTTETTPQASPEAGQEVLTGADVGDLGKVIVDSEGMTVYEFAKDQGTTSSCYGACEEAWPPVTTEGEPSVGEGASQDQLGTTERKDGTVQVTYAGHPLYTFVEDKGPSEANGNGSEAFGGEWWALTESGSAAEGGGGEEEKSGGGGYSGY